MVAFLRWAGSIVAGTLNGLIKFTLAILLILIVISLFAMARGDKMPGSMVLSIDLRKDVADSRPGKYSFGARAPTVLDIVLGLDAAERDPRVKGVFLRLGTGALSVAEAEEIGAALKRFRASGKFVIAHAQGFDGAGLGDYVTATAADQIWMQPKSSFAAAGVGGGEFFVRGLLDKIKAEPQIAKRSEYKSAADMFMESSMTKEDREQLQELMKSTYDAAVNTAAADRKISRAAMVAALDASPQFTEDAKAKKLIDQIGFDDDALGAALNKAGGDAQAITLSQFLGAKVASAYGSGPHIALVQASGEIVEGSTGGGPFDNSSVIAGDDMAHAIREATADKDVKAIILRVDSPGGSVAASDQILDAVKKAQAAGKPVVVSMGGVAASGGYYISLSANKIVAHPATITGSIGVLTGKVSIGNTLGLVGVKGELVGVGKNALMNSDLAPYTPEQWAALNAEADGIYADFTKKVAEGRKLPLAKVQEVARGRVWTGADAKERGLVDKLGGFWDAADVAKRLAGVPAGDRVRFKLYPRQKGFLETVSDWLNGDDDEVQAIENFKTLMTSPVISHTAHAVRQAPRAGIELRAANLPE
ncbi:protease-4 [Rhizomicrobium palustre]|uniref:Protease-4 n=1 Tax=Rhizomicrobium palustre TaxID=189966 RepID=A0A846N0P5_9PROT|nr:signal peptide peptidase SppA [Rhizomicrobium palustre]NIK89266.1 protease-4 [Rhizomicrobium palustre]